MNALNAERTAPSLTILPLKRYQRIRNQRQLKKSTLYSRVRALFEGVPMKLMKVVLASTLAGSVAYAVTGPRLDDSIAQLNQEAARVVAPYLNATTKAKITFVKVTTNADRVLEARGNASYSKVGTKNSFAINVSDLSYVYGNGSAPASRLKANVAIDLTKSMTQEQINEIGGSVVAMIESAAKENLRDYGDAVKVVAKVISEKKDAKGNFLSIDGEVVGTVDLSKLPTGKKPEDVAVSKVIVKVGVDAKKGITLDASSISNSKYKGFKPGAPDSLKEILEKFLARDAKVTKQIDDAVRFVEDFANGLVN